MKKIALFLVGISFLNAYGQSSSTQSFSLKEAIQYAESHNPDYQKAHLDVKIANETRLQTLAVGLPQVSLNGSFQQFIQVPSQYIKNFATTAPGAPEYIKLAFQQKVSSSGNLSVNQLLFDGSYIVGLQASKEFTSFSKLLEAKSLNDLQLNIAKAYLMVVTTEKNIEVVRANIKTLEKSSKDVTELNKEGFAEKLDVQRLNLALSNLKVQEEKLLNGVKTLKNVLKLQMGLDVNTDITLSDNLEKINENIAMAETATPVFDPSLRIEYQILNKSLALSSLDQKRYKMGYLPRLVGFYQNTMSTQRPEFNFFQSNLPINNSWIPSSVIGLQLQFTLFDGLGGVSRIREAGFRINKVKIDLTNFQNAANMQFKNANNTYETQLKQAGLQKENLDLAKQIYETAQAKYKEGVGSSLELMQAEADLKNAQNNYLSAIYDLVMAKIDFYQSTGKSLN